MFTWADRALARLPRAAVVALALFGLALIGAADYFSGYQISLGVFYLLPVGFATWYGGRRTGVGFAIASSLVWYLAEAASGPPYDHPAFPIWNAFVRLSFFLIIAVLLSSLCERLTAEQRLARTDGLTGLMNARALTEQLEHDLALSERTAAPLTLVYLDLDDFKTINDTCGHAEGDRVLRSIGQALIRATRRSDSVARVGGDEFALILPATDIDGAEIVIAKLRQLLGELTADGERHVTCSIGAVAFQEHRAGSHEAIAAADRLMYEAKISGKNTVVLRGYVHPNSAPLPPRDKATTTQTAGRIALIAWLKRWKGR